MIMLNMKSGESLWEQIRDSFKKQILSGALTAGEKLPSVRALAGELGINPNTIQKAISALESEGFVYTVAGKGCFVCEIDEAAMVIEKTRRLDVFRTAVLSALEAGIDKRALEQIIEKEYDK